jgi:hypothetical protein
MLNRLALVRKYNRRGKLSRFCCICNKQIKNQQRYFCSIQCYTRFRLGLGIDYTKIVCRYPKRPTDRDHIIEYQKKKFNCGFIDYENFYYCRKCELRVPISEGLIRCPECNRLIHHIKKNKLRNNKTKKAEDNRIRI